VDWTDHAIKEEKVNDNPYRRPGIVSRVFEPIQEMSIEKLVTLAVSLVMTLILSLLAGFCASDIIVAIKQPPQPAGFEGPCVDALLPMTYGAVCKHSNHVSTVETDENKGRWFRCTCARSSCASAIDAGVAQDAGAE
jgi:hypothetical protein